MERSKNWTIIVSNIKLSGLKELGKRLTSWISRNKKGSGGDWTAPCQEDRKKTKIKNQMPGNGTQMEPGF